MLMKSSFYGLSLIAAWLTFSASYSSASVVSISCSNENRLQTAIDAITPGVSSTINISGTCKENLTVPAGKIVTLKGVGSNAKLIPSDDSRAVLVSYGDTTIQQMTVTNPSGVAEAVIEASAGTIRVFGSVVSGPNVGSVVGVWSNSYGRIANSRIMGGSYAAIEAWASSVVELAGYAGEPTNSDGAKSTVTSTNGRGVACSGGSSLWIRARLDNFLPGSVEISASQTGLFLEQCDASLQNDTAQSSNLTITKIKSTGYAIYSDSSRLKLRKTQVANNSGYGLYSLTSQVSITGASFSSNKKSDTYAMANSTLRFSSPPTSFPSAFTSPQNSFLCSGPNKSAQFAIDNDSISLPTGKSMSELYATYKSCLKIWP